MNWTRGVLYLCVVVHLYWWGVRVLLKVPSRQGGDRELDARWLQEQEARRQTKGARKQRLALIDGLVYLLLTLLLGSALGWVICGFVQE
jgi:hypothetical protein